MEKTKDIGTEKHPELIPLWIAVFVDILGFSIIIPLLAYIADEMAIPESEIGIKVAILLSANALFGFLSQPFWGKLSDLKGRKPMLIICQFGTLIAFLLMAFSRSYNMLLFSRIFDGIFGGNFPIVKAIIGDAIPPKQRSKYMSNIGTAHITASVLGPGIGGLMADTGIFGLGLISASLTVIVLITTITKVKETNPKILKMKAHEDFVTLPRLTLSDLFNNDKKGVLKGNFLAKFILIQWTLHTLSFFIYIPSIGTFSKIVMGLTPQELGLLLTISGLFRLFIRFVIFVPMIEKLGERITSLIGFIIFPFAFLMLYWVDTPLELGILSLFISFAASCVRSILTSYASRAVSPKDQGVMMGYSSSLDAFAQMIGPFIGGIIIDTGNVFWYGGSAALCALGALGMASKNFHEELVSKEEKYLAEMRK